jgi:hypothetical protein
MGILSRRQKQGMLRLDLGSRCGLIWVTDQEWIEGVQMSERCRRRDEDFGKGKIKVGCGWRNRV